MVSSINSVLVNTLFNTNSDTPGVSADVLAAAIAAKAGVTSSTTDVAADPNAPIEPVWSPGLTPSAATLYANALADKPFFDLNTPLYSQLSATGDYKRLFALHTGISTLQALAAQMKDSTLSAAQKQSIQMQFQRGLKELDAFFKTQKFDDVRLEEGDRIDSDQTTLAIPSTSEDYTTPVIQKGELTGAFAGLDPNAKFDVVVTSAVGNVHRVTIDLSQMGSITRSLSNVLGFVNSKLLTAGVATRLETVNQTPKTTNLVIGGQTITQPYVGPKQYALKVNVQGGESVAFQPAAFDPAFYVVGQTNSGARLIKLSDTSGASGQPVFLDRPSTTQNPIGPDVATGWLDNGVIATQKDTPALMSAGSNNFEDALRAAGEAVLNVSLADGRKISVSTAWRSDDLENWRVRSGETEDQGILGDLADRLTQLLHEQGIAAGVTTWTDVNNAGLSVLTGDGVTATSLTIGGRAASLTTDADTLSDMVGGLRDGIYARSFQTGAVVGAYSLLSGDQNVTVTTTDKTLTFTLGGTDQTLQSFITRLNQQFQSSGIAAAASFVDAGNGALALRVDGLHDLTAVSATINGVDSDANLIAPDSNVLGGLPLSDPGKPFGDAVRETDVSGSPLTDNPGALDIQVVVATPTGTKTVSVAVSAAERANDPDPASGEWSSTFQDRLNAALNAAGVYVGSAGNDLTHWHTAEGSSQRIQSITVNGQALDLTSAQPALGLGGAFTVERSFTSAQAAGAADEDIPALDSDPNVSITFDTVWGAQTVSAALDSGDPRTLQSAALRLNQALANAGYDLGVETTDLAGGGSGLRIVVGASHSITNVSAVSLGGSASAVTLDPIDSQTHADDPVAAADVATRASRGAAITQTLPATTAILPPSAGGSGWFPGRAFDVAIGDGAKVATARAVATGPNGAVYVLADLDGDSATTPIKGARDVALLKYDSAGALVYSRILGATDQANGYALAVSADGKVAVAGSVQGTLTGTSAKGALDSFVSVYDASGNQLWTARRGATADDQASAVAFASNGDVIVAGKTQSALSPALALGGADAYLRGYSATGSELFTRQFGTGGDDNATALLVRDDGAGGMQIFTGGVENNRGMLRSFSYAPNAGLTAGAARDIGYFYGGAISALAADGGDLYVGGQIGADRLTLGTPARGAVAGQDGFVARMSTNLASTARDRSTYLGSAQDDAVNGLAVVDGAVYASGVDGGVMAGQGHASSKTGFIARLADDGDVAWLRSFSTAGGAATIVGLAVDATGASALDALGLPSGAVAAGDSTALAQRSALKAGDQFQIGVAGGLLRTITIKPSDTMRTLATSINRALGTAGRADIVKDNGAERLKITAADGRAVSVVAGPTGKDALAGLGLSAGVIAVNSTKKNSLKTFGLGLVASDLKLADAASIAKTSAELTAAISIVHQAYDALLHPNAKPLTDEQKALQARQAAAASAAPAYLTSQIANYKAALARLGGG